MKRNSIIIQGLILGIVCLPLFSWSQTSKPVSTDKELKGRDAVPEFMGKSFRYQTLAGQNSDGTRGIGLQKGVTRRDPSDVIKVGNTYYVWYSKAVHVEVDAHKQFPAARCYYGFGISYATSQDEGHTWVEQGEALGAGEEGAWDSHIVYAPNILKFKNKYYLYYDGVMPTPDRTHGFFENNHKTDFSHTGVAVSDSPDGPWKRMNGGEPINRVSPDKKAFDSYRAIDSCLLVRDGKIWLYYKGRPLAGGGHGPGQTQMGVAFAEKPEGPYIKYEGNPILPRSHEVCIWPHREGVAAYASLSQTFEYAPDGLDFTSDKIGIHTPRAIALGTFRPDLTDPNETVYGTGVSWGLSMLQPGGPSPHLVRWECDLTVPKAGE